LGIDVEKLPKLLKTKKTMSEEEKAGIQQQNESLKKVGRILSRLDAYNNL